jgi:hypothetical protein
VSRGAARVIVQHRTLSWLRRTGTPSVAAELAAVSPCPVTWVPEYGSSWLPDPPDIGAWLRGNESVQGSSRHLLVKRSGNRELRLVGRPRAAHGVLGRIIEALVERALCPLEVVPEGSQCAIHPCHRLLQHRLQSPKRAASCVRARTPGQRTGPQGSLDAGDDVVVTGATRDNWSRAWNVRR